MINEMSNKPNSKTAYILAIITVLLFALVLAIDKGWHKHTQSIAIKNTKSMLADLAKRHKNDKIGTMLEWSNGTFIDSWGNSPALYKSTREQVQFASKGPDGVLDTEDDILGETIKIRQQKLVSDDNKKDEEPKEEPSGWKIHWKWGKIKS